MIFDNQSRLMPATATRFLLRIDRRDRIGRHHDRPVVGLAEQIVAENEIAGLLRLPEIVAIADVEADLNVQRGALHHALLAHEHDAADPGQVGGQAGAQDFATSADAAGCADIGGRFQHRLDGGNHLALGLGAVVGDIGVFLGGDRDLLGPGVFERAHAFQHQGSHQHHGQHRKPRPDSQKLLEFDPIAVESNARHPCPPHRRVERRFQKAFPELGKIRGNAVKFPTEIRT